ncbi:hypothetical protein GCM10028817_45740 [Spirosoma pomorum]
MDAGWCNLSRFISRYCFGASKEARYEQVNLYCPINRSQTSRSSNLRYHH